MAIEAQLSGAAAIGPLSSLGRLLINAQIAAPPAVVQKKHSRVCHNELKIVSLVAGEGFPPMTDELKRAGPREKRNAPWGRVSYDVIRQAD